MCMICKGLERGKFNPEQAREKLDEFVDLELLDEDHQEIVESLIAEMEEEEYYWDTAKKNTRKYEDYNDEDEAVDEQFIDESLSENPYEEES